MPTDNLINEDRFSFSPPSFNKIFVFLNETVAKSDDVGRGEISFPVFQTYPTSALIPREERHASSASAKRRAFLFVR